MSIPSSWITYGRVLDQGLVWDVDDLVLPPCAPELGVGWSLHHPVVWTMSDVSISVVLGVKVIIGEQREFRLASCPENHFRCI